MHLYIHYLRNIYSLLNIYQSLEKIIEDLALSPLPYSLPFLLSPPLSFSLPLFPHVSSSLFLTPSLSSCFILSFSDTIFPPVYSSLSLPLLLPVFSLFRSLSFLISSSKSLFAPFSSSLSFLQYSTFSLFPTDNRTALTCMT